MNQLAASPAVAPQVFLDTSEEHADILAQLDQFYRDGDPPILPLPEGVLFIYARDLYQYQLVICHDYILTTDGKRIWTRYRTHRSIGMCWTRPGDTPRVVIHWDQPQFGIEPLVNHPRSISVAQLVLRGTQPNPDWSHYPDVAHLDGNLQNNSKENLAYSTRLGRRSRGRKGYQVYAHIGS